MVCIGLLASGQQLKPLRSCLCGALTLGSYYQAVAAVTCREVSLLGDKHRFVTPGNKYGKH